MALLRTLANRQLLSFPLTRATTCVSSSRAYTALCVLPHLHSANPRPIVHCQQRRYASKKAKAKSTDNIVPGSQQKLQDPAAQAEYEKAETTMKTAVEWFLMECTRFGIRALGRVTPTILAPVRINLPGIKKVYSVEDLATVGVRENSYLLVTLIDEKNMKHVESALHTCKIPGVVPHKQDSRTIKIPISKPTVEAKQSLYTGAKKKAEQIRSQIRRQHTMSMKKFEKHSIEAEEFQKLTDKYIGEVDRILKNLQKSTGGK